MKQFVITIFLFFPFFFTIKTEITIINNTGKYLTLAIPETGPSSQKAKKMLGRSSKRSIEEIETAKEFRNALKITKKTNDFFIQTKKDGTNVFYQLEKQQRNSLNGVFSLEKKLSMFGVEEEIEEFELKPLLRKETYVRSINLNKIQTPEISLIQMKFPKTPLFFKFSEQSANIFTKLKLNIYFKQKKDRAPEEQLVSLNSKFEVVEPFESNIALFVFLNNDFSQIFPFEINFNELIYSEPYTVEFTKSKQQKEDILKFVIPDKASKNFVNLVGDDKEELNLIIKKTLNATQKYKDFLEFNGIQKDFYEQYLTDERYKTFAFNKLEYIEKEKDEALKETETSFNNKISETLGFYPWKKFIFIEKSRSFSI
ncbi:MAG: hypothetical protein ABIA74_00750 [bacterium]